MKCKQCKYKPVQPERHPCNNCKHCPVGEYDNFEPAEPVVLSAEEILNERISALCLQPRRDTIIKYGEAMHQNGRLERDLELRGLVEAAKYADDTITSEMTGIRKIGEALENLKPLNQD